VLRPARRAKNSAGAKHTSTDAAAISQSRGVSVIEATLYRIWLAAAGAGQAGRSNDGAAGNPHLSDGARGGRTIARGLRAGVRRRYLIVSESMPMLIA